MPNVLLGALNATKRLAMDEALSLNQFAVAFKFYLLHFVIYVSSLLLFDANTLRYLILGNISKSAYFTDLLVSPVF